MLPSITTSPAVVVAIIALTLPLSGCDQAPPTSATDVPLPNTAAARAGRTDGAFVFRGSVPGGLLMIDFDRERTLLVGNTDAQLAGICATGALPEEVTEHDVFAPNGVLHVLLQAGHCPRWCIPS